MRASSAPRGGTGPKPLAALARLAMAPPSRIAAADIVQACDILRDALAADEAYVVRSGDPHFIRLGSDAAPTAYEIKQKGYFLIWRDLTARPEIIGAAVRVAGRLVEERIPLDVGARPTHLAAVLPGYESNAEMIIVRGAWPEGLTAAQIEFLTVARPLLALLVHNVLDAERQVRQRHQLSLLADVAGAFGDGQQVDSVLTAIATAVAKASGFDWVNIALFDAAMEHVAEYAQNIARYSNTALAAKFTAMGRSADANAVWLADARRMQRTGRPVLIPDIGELGRRDSGDDTVRRYQQAFRRSCERAHILSTAVFPIRFQDRVLGSMFFSSTTRRGFDPEEVEFLSALVAQAAASIGGLQLHEELRRANAALAHVATHDALTGLPNRTLFRERLQRALDRPAAGDDDAVALLFIDLDNFKMINDSLGHPAGDELLIGAAARLSGAMRAEDIVARFGGDEFAVLVCGAVRALTALRLAERLVTTLRAPMIVAGREVMIEASVGIALGTPGRSTADDLLREADTALYQAKGAGKAQAAIFDADVSVRTRARLELEADLRGALERQEFVLYYQPEVELSTGRIVGMEALVRWQHPRRGLVPPGEFIPLMEETGLVVPLGRWVLAEACKQAAAWQHAARGGRPLVMSVNIAAPQLARRDLAEQVAEALGEAGLPPSALRLEITESAVMADMDLAIANLAACKEIGVQVALDDFGTGYSSLSYLLRFPVDTLKIDRSFVQRLGTDKGAIAVVRAVTATARALGLGVTAEGIETATELNRVRSLRCRRGQGYYFARPLPADVLTGHLAPSGAGGGRLRPTLPAPLPARTASVPPRPVDAACGEQPEWLQPDAGPHRTVIEATEAARLSA